MPAPDGGDDFIGIGGPDEGFWVFVVLIQEAVDGGLKVDDGAEDTALQAALGELGEEALDGVEPGRRGFPTRSPASLQYWIARSSSGWNLTLGARV